MHYNVVTRLSFATLPGPPSSHQGRHQPPSEWWQLATGHQCHQCGHGPLVPWFRMTTTWTFLWDSFISFESQPDRRNVKKVTFKLLFLCSLHLTCLPSMNNDQENTRTCATWSRQSDSDRLIGVRSAIYFVTRRVWMINTKAVLTSSFHATKHNMQHCNPALGVIKLCNYSLDCWIYGLNDLNTDKTVVTGAGVAKLLPGANSYYDLTLILFTNRMNWIVMSSQKPHTEYDMWYFKGWAETRVTPQKIMIFGIFVVQTSPESIEWRRNVWWVFDEGVTMENGNWWV